MFRIHALVVLVVLTFTSVGAGAHSMGDVEASLHDKERYAQFVDRSAPPFNLTDSNGRALSLSELQGKTVVLNFLYTRCKEACPVHMNLIRHLQARVAEEGLSDKVTFITIATDREDVTGTRKNMQAYGKNFDLDPSNWHFLYRTSAESPVLTSELADTYGLRFADTDEGQVHGVVTHVIDPSGQMRARFHGLKFQPEHLVTYLKAIALGPDAASDGFWDQLHEKVEGLLGKS